MKSFAGVALLVMSSCFPLWAQDVTKPQSLDARIKIELFADSPQIVTPTGIDIDHRGRVWAIESNTHFRPDDYTGHPSDRVLVMSDTDDDGKADRIVTFADGLTYTMSVAVRPNGDVYIATRKEIFLMHDDDGDDRADRRQSIMRLDTPGNYPHNGLAGLAFDALDRLYFGFGENLGADYKLIGADGTTLSGGGEGGNIYRCRPDGTQLEYWATGFWNPHASCIDAFGRLFTVDNDPDSRPPCRLLHIIRHGDYGYRFRNGRKGLHPFTAWDGELAGTLPMLAGTGEAPSGVLAYEGNNLPRQYRGGLFVGTWGDHRIDHFRLQPHGASFRSRAEPLIVGGENFRPVGLAVAPDGSMYCTDWVLRDYKLHGQGRIWRISSVASAESDVVDVTEITAGLPISTLTSHLASSRVPVRRAAARALAETPSGRRELQNRLLQADQSNEKEPMRTRQQIEAMWALSRIPVEQFQMQPPTDLALLPAWQQLQGTSPQYMAPVQISVSQLAADPKLANWQADPAQQSQHDIQVSRWLLAVIPDVEVGTSETWLREEARLERTIDIASDPFLMTAMIDRYSAASVSKDDLRKLLESNIARQGSPAYRVAYLLAAKARFPESTEFVEHGLRDSDQAVARAAVQWVAEGEMTQYRTVVESLLHQGVLTDQLFLSTIAALQLLDGADPVQIDRGLASEHVLQILGDQGRPAQLRAQALRLLPQNTSRLKPALLKQLLNSDDPQVKLEAVRALQLAGTPDAYALLLPVAADTRADVEIRTEAALGLVSGLSQPTASQPTTSQQAAAQQTRALFIDWLRSNDRTLRNEGLRAVRNLVSIDAQLKSALDEVVDTGLQSVATAAQKRDLADLLAMTFSSNELEIPADVAAARTPRPNTTSEWIEQTTTGGDRQVGRRLFFHANSAGCFKCHTVNGRGGAVGPDLSVVARTMDRRKLAESILDPSREVSPQFVMWSVVTNDGKVHNGLILNDATNQIRLGRADGTTISIPTSEIESRTPQKASIMPEKLIEQLTVSEFRDLLAFLETLK